MVADRFLEVARTNVATPYVVYCESDVCYENAREIVNECVRALYPALFPSRYPLMVSKDAYLIRCWTGFRWCKPPTIVACMILKYMHVRLLYSSVILIIHDEIVLIIRVIIF